uniref:Charged multivesicular body protein 1b-2 n=1 Tax=Macrostomum lignano TaxID=282301 RepID=A0A1I8FCN5_9PLAT
TTSRDRQDRYLLIRDAPRLCDFLAKAGSTACPTVGTAGLGRLPVPAQPGRPPVAGDRVNRLIAEFATSQDCSGEGADSTVYAMRCRWGPWECAMTPTPPSGLLHQLPSADAELAEHQLHLAPTAFYKSTRPSYFIPAAYSQLERQFLAAAAKLRQTPAAEAARSPVCWPSTRGPAGPSTPKGLWLGDARPASGFGLTLVGSSNFGYRTRGCAIWKSSSAWPPTATWLAARLAEERDGLFQHGQPVSMATLNAADRRAPAWLRLAMPRFKTYCSVCSASGNNMEKHLFNLKFAAKDLERNAKKCEKDEKKGNMEGAKIHAENSIRQKNQALNYRRMASRIDAVAARVQTAVTTKQYAITLLKEESKLDIHNPAQQVTKSMAGVVKGMEAAMKSMNLEQISQLMDRFETRIRKISTDGGHHVQHIHPDCAEGRGNMLMQEAPPTRPGIEIKMQLPHGRQIQAVAHRHRQRRN